jgi:two-component system response regulator HydG
MERMMAYPWPGNVRELRNVIERASLLLRGDEITPANLLLHGTLNQNFPADETTRADQEIPSLEEMKRRHILSALEACSGNKSLTARNLDISLSTLKRNLKEMNVN